MLSSSWGSSGWSFSFGSGYYGGCFSLWYPWYLCSIFAWPGSYRSCWWDTWSNPCWSPSSYWWYPVSSYYPNYVYVPSSTVVITETTDDGSEAPPAEEIVVAGSDTAPAAEAPADLAARYLRLGDLYFKAGNFEEAADAYARARTYAPDDAALHFVLSDAAFAVGDYHFAAFLIAEALRLDPALASAEVDKRDFYGDARLFDEHMAALDKYLGDKPEDASAHLVRGYNLCFSERPAAAVAAFRRVLEIVPDQRAARIFLDVLAPEKDALAPEKDTPRKDRK